NFCAHSLPRHQQQHALRFVADSRKGERYEAGGVGQQTIAMIDPDFRDGRRWTQLHVRDRELRSVVTTNAAGDLRCPRGTAKRGEIQKNTENSHGAWTTMAAIIGANENRRNNRIAVAILMVTSAAIAGAADRHGHVLKRAISWAARMEPPPQIVTMLLNAKY